jgi:hypothetical protein
MRHDWSHARENATYFFKTDSPPKLRRTTSEKMYRYFFDSLESHPQSVHPMTIG